MKDGMGLNKETKAVGAEDYSLHELIARRRSQKAFSERHVDMPTLKSLLEAARWAPSSRNEQPWRFIVASKSENAAEFERIFSTLNDSNKVWAYQASALIAVTANLTSSRDAKPNHHAQYDTGGAVANLTMQAVSFGLQVHQMGGFNLVMLREMYNIPSHFQPIAVLAIGYPDDLREQKQRTRKELHEFVFESEWGKSSTTVNL